MRQSHSGMPGIYAAHTECLVFYECGLLFGTHDVDVNSEGEISVWGVEGEITF